MVVGSPLQSYRQWLSVVLVLLIAGVVAVATPGAAHASATKIAIEVPTMAPTTAPQQVASYRTDPEPTEIGNTTIPTTPDLQTADVPLADVLGNDCALDITVGASLSIDASGYEMTTAPDGSPCFVATDPARPLAPGDEGWQTGFGMGGASGEVYAIASDGTGNIYIGGTFLQVDGILANRVAKWDGAAWSALGDSASTNNGLNDEVNALVVSGTNLYVGGSFTVATTSTGGTINTQHIARWNTATGTWSALGDGTTANNGVNGPVLALAMLGTDLYVGGTFATATNSTGGTVNTRNIARWTPAGNIWTALGNGTNANNGVNDSVYALAVLGTDLYVGGTFTQGTLSTSTLVSLRNIARWTPTSNIWTALGTGTNNNNGVNNSVHTLAVIGNDLYLGGSFGFATTISGNTITMRFVGRWNTITGTWTPLGGTSNGMNRQVNALAVIGGDLYVGGVFTTTTTGTTLNVRYIARWNATTDTWTALGDGTTANNGLNDTVHALAVVGNGLYVGGQFLNATTSTGSTVNTHSIARWNPTNSTWTTPTSGTNTNNGVNSTVYTLVVTGNDLYMGGNFTYVGGIPANRIAKWDGTHWTALGDSTTGNNGVNGDVRALAVVGNDLYVGGQFLNATTSTGATINTRNIARWDTINATWNALGDGTTSNNGVNNTVHVLKVLGSDLYVGGQFLNATTSTGTNVNTRNIARWDTTTATWNALGDGTTINNGVNNTVAALAVVGSDLYMGGNFTIARTSAGTTVNTQRIARWNTINAAWNALGDGTTANNGVNGQVTAMAVVGSDLYVGGAFTTATSTGTTVNTQRIARWDTINATWNALGDGTTLNNGVNNTVNALAVLGNDLYLGGPFTAATTSTGTIVATSHAAKWDGVTWYGLGSGTTNTVFALTIVTPTPLAPPTTLLYVGGTFERAGQIPSVNIGAFDVNVPLAVTLASFDATPQRDYMLVAWETAQETDNLGFHLYRSTDPASQGERLNGELILSQAPGGGGASYTFPDATVIEDTTYFYTLETVALDGSTALHGPVSATYHEPTAITLGTWNVERENGNGWLAFLAGGLLLAVAGVGIAKRH